MIGKGGRVAQALRTIVRASAEGKVTIDIVDVEDDDEHEADLEHSPAPVDAEDTADLKTIATGATGADDEDEGEDAAPAVAPKKKPAAKKTAAKKTAAKKTTAKKTPSAAAAPKRKKNA